jgi:hypothetical protein
MDNPLTAYMVSRRENAAKNVFFTRRDVNSIIAAIQAAGGTAPAAGTNSRRRQQRVAGGVAAGGMELREVDLEPIPLTKKVTCTSGGGSLALGGARAVRLQRYRRTLAASAFGPPQPN